MNNLKSTAANVLVTGGAGYIGSHAVKELIKHGHKVTILDNLVYGHEDLAQKLNAELVTGDISDTELVTSLLVEKEIQAVIHFAAYAYVGESVTNPEKYYQNNVAGTLKLLEAMKTASVKNIVFSSTCATYGIPKTVPILEESPQVPINPYGMSKLMVERILWDYSNAYDLRAVCFRYFNAAGADPDGKLGEDHNPETHLIPLTLLTALGKRDSISIFGTDYDTPDGTCVRDYIHVTDLATAHVLGMRYLLDGGESTVFNLGNGSGFSVREVIDTAKQVTGINFKVEEKERRAGDPPALVGSAEKAKAVLGWQPQYFDLETILTHAWKWHQSRHD